MGKKLQYGTVNISSVRKYAVPKRFVLTLLGFLGFFCAYALRVNLSVAIVAMVREPLLQDVSRDNDTAVACPELVEHPVNRTGLGKRSSAIAKGEFDWDSNLQGVVLGSFYYGYILTQIPGGVLAERYGAKWIYGLGILLTAVLSLLTPLMARWSVWVLIVTRVIEGLCEGVTYPAMHSMIGRWIPIQERSRISTLIYCGSEIGAMFSLSISGLLCDSEFLGGWPAAFYVFGSFGCLWFVLWISLVFDTPEDHPKISKDELLHIRLGQDNVHSNKSPTPWKKIFTSVPVWGLVITNFGFSWAHYIILTDQPTYLSNILHFNLKKNGAVSAVPNLVGVLIAVIASSIADKMLASGRFRTITIRKTMNSIAFFVPALCLLIIPFIGCRSTIIVLLLSSVVSLSGFIYSGSNITHLDMSPEFAGTLKGITNGFGNVAGFMAPSFVGWMIQDGNSMANWGKVFVSTSVIFFASGMVFIIFGTAELQPWGSNDKPSQQNGEETDVTVMTATFSDTRTMKLDSIAKST